jgi:septum formation protein
MTKRLILASTSRYRRELLQRLGLPFDCEAPGTDEAEVAAESPATRSRRLAVAKAAAVAARFPDAWVIGSDQVASCQGPDGSLVLLDKPGTPERQREQLGLLSGRSASFHTAVAVVGPGLRLEHIDVTTVDFRPFSAAEAERYMQQERALDCAGGFKAEGAGVTLMQRLRSEDPTGIIGLPLIWVCDALRAAGFSVP